MAVDDYATDPDLNTTISGINIAEGCPPSGINNAIRQLMADVKEKSDNLLPLHGTADAALKLKTARQLDFSGDATGKGSFDGSAPLSIKLTLKSLFTNAGSVGSANDFTVGFGKSFSVPYFSYDTAGRLTAAGVRTITLPSDARITATEASADAAQTSADAAQTSADAAQTSADAAQTSADAALAAAQTAQGTADSKADDSAVVHNTGTETVAGVKTFTSNPVVSVAAPNFVLKQTDADRATVPTSDQYCQMQMQDKNGKVMGNICNMQLTSGASRTFMNAYNSSGTAATVGVQYPAGDGAVPYGYAPNPAATSNSNHIATTAWVRAMRFNGSAPASDRSVLVPPMLDDSMMTLIFDGGDSGISSGNITLSQPYTDFKALCILYGGDTLGKFIMSDIVTVWELEQRKNVGTTFTLFNGYKYWECSSATSTTTFFDHYDDNSRVYKIWGIK